MDIIILKPQDLCYGIVDAFAVNFGQALSDRGIGVDYFDLKVQPLGELAGVLQKRYGAVVDFYSGLLCIKDENGDYLWDGMGVPVIQICLDFPVYIMDKMGAGLQRYYAFCMDRHFCEVVGECLPNIKDAYFFPMAGREGNAAKVPWEERCHDIVFIGTYWDYRCWLVELNQMEEGIKKLGYAFFCVMRDSVELDQLQAFERVLGQLQIQISKSECYQWLRMVGGIAKSAVFYQREQVIKVLLEAGLEVEVFGDSWKVSPLAAYSNLIIREQLKEEEYISVLEQAKLSLNITYCNRASYSERYAYSMLNGAVCVSDESEYLCEEFQDGQNIVFYRLDKLEQLPGKLKRLLEHPQEAQSIADAAYKKAAREHTWEQRAGQFLDILGQLYCKPPECTVCKELPGWRSAAKAIGSSLK